MDKRSGPCPSFERTDGPLSDRCRTVVGTLDSFPKSNINLTRFETYSRLHQTDFRLSNGLIFICVATPSLGARIVMLRTHKATHRGCAICSERLQELQDLANSSQSGSAHLQCSNSSQHNKGVNIAALLTQPSNATFRYALTVSMRCYDTIPKRLWVSEPVASAMPMYDSRLPRRFMGVPDFCKSHTSLQWPSCPPPLSSLSIDDVFFGVMTARRLLSSRARVVSRTLALQGARHALFGDEDLNNATLGYMTQLPESAKLEHWNGGGRRPPFVAQK